MEFQRKKRRRSISQSWVTVVILVLAVFVLSRAVWNLYGKEVQSAQANAEAASELAALKAQEASLSSDVQELSTPQGVERDIRENFNMAKPGEKLVIVLNDSQASDTPEVIPTGFWGSLWGMIKGAF